MLRILSHLALLFALVQAGTAIAKERPSKGKKHQRAGKNKVRTSKKSKSLKAARPVTGAALAKAAKAVCACKNAKCATKVLRNLSKKYGAPRSKAKRSLKPQLDQIQNCAKKFGKTQSGSGTTALPSFWNDLVDWWNKSVNCSLQKNNWKECNCGFTKKAGDKYCERKNSRYPYFTGRCLCEGGGCTAQCTNNSSAKTLGGDDPDEKTFE